jgi:arginyl-tRNA synthetase
MLRQRITSSLNEAISSYLQSKGIAENLKFAIDIPPYGIDADFSVNAAMHIAKKLKASPKVIAQELIGIVLKKMPDFIEKAEIADPGFINIRIKNEVLYDELKTILREKDNYGAFPENNKEMIMVEFISANPTGPLHIGHGRGAAIGDSLARILKHLGHNVVKEYYLNDVGNQIFVLAKSTEIRYKQLKGENIELPSEFYQGDYVVDIAKHLICECKNINEIDFKREAVKYIFKLIKEDLRNFGVEFDIWFSESDIAFVKDADGKTEIDNVCDYLLAKKYA